MSKVILVGRDQGRLRNIKEVIKDSQPNIPNMKIYTSQPSFFHSLVDEHLSLLLLDIPVIGKASFPLIREVRKKAYVGPILLMGAFGQTFNTEYLNKYNNLFHIPGSADKDQLLSMVTKCLSAEQMKRRRDQRFDVNEQAMLEAYSSEFKTEATINNISKSGLRLEGKLEGLNQGSLVRLHFNFDKIKKERTMSARVVWINKRHDKPHSAGLEFVSQKSVYQYLLNYAVA